MRRFRQEDTAGIEKTAWSMEHGGGTMRSVSFLDKDIRLRRPQASSDAVSLRVAARCAMHSTPRGAGDATCIGPMQTYRESPAVCPADAQGVCCVLRAIGPCCLAEVGGAIDHRHAPVAARSGCSSCSRCGSRRDGRSVPRGIRGVPACAGRSPDVKKARPKKRPPCGRVRRNYDRPMHLSMCPARA